MLIIVISSSLDEPVLISNDGINDHIFVLSNGSLEFNVCANKQHTSKLEFPLGTQFYIKEGPDGPPTTGHIFMSFVYP